MTKCCPLLIFVVCSVAVAGQPAATRLPVPDSAAVEKAEKLVRELFKADLAKKKQADQIETARKMIKSAGETNDNPAAKFALLREASEVAARGGDIGTALEAAAGLTQSFEMKPVDVQLGILETAERGKTVPARAVAEAALEVADDALRADDFDSADKLLKLAVRAATRASNAALSANVAAKIREAEAIQQVLGQLEPERKKLASDPNDAAANQKVGRFLAVLKGEWDAGLPHLAKSGDEKWKAAAEADLTSPIAANDRTALADRWFDLAATLEGPDATELRFRAYQWYSQALADLSGLSKARVEKRMAEIEKSADFKSARGAGWSVVFRSSDAAIWNTDTNRGRYHFATPLAKAPVGLRYLRLAETMKGTFVIIEMSKDRLDGNFEKDGYAWSGKSNLEFNGRHLGISDTAWGNPQKGAIAVYNVPFQAAYRGWGFGNRSYIDDGQGYAWLGEPVAKMVFEFAVKVGPLTADETKRMLKKKK